MKRKICMAVVLGALFCCMLTGCFSQENSGLPKKGEIIQGFEVTKVDKCKNGTIDYVTFSHEKTGAEVLYLATDDINRAFNISFRTPAGNNKGIAHVLEHAVMTGSRKYPSVDFFSKATVQTYNTFMNATTTANCTHYPVSSLSEEQLYKLSDYYLDSVFYPYFYEDNSVFRQEAWRYELDNANDDLTVSGTVYSEMEGIESIGNSTYYNAMSALYSGSELAYVSGGIPSEIAKITDEEIIDFHKRYYHPSNSMTVLYGKLDYWNFLGLIDSYFSEFEKKDMTDIKKSYISSQDYTEKIVDYPVYNGDTTKSNMMYYVECKGGYESDLYVLKCMAEALQDNSSIFMSRTTEELPGVSRGCGVITNTYEPLIVFSANNIKEEDKETFKSIVDETLDDFVKNGFSEWDKRGEIIDAKNRRLEAEGLTGENVGADLAVSIAKMWGMTDEISPENVESLSDTTEVDNIDIKKAAEKYFKTGRKVLSVSVPRAGLREQQQADLKAQLAQIKSKMTAEEINSIVETTKLYDTGVDNTALDEQLLEKISAVDAQSLPEEYENYEITDEVIDGVRYINVKTDIADIGKGRVMIDVSDIKGENLYWLILYNALVNITGYEVRDRYFDGGTQLKQVETDEGFIPYLIYEYKGFSKDSEKIFEFMNQALFYNPIGNGEAYGNFIEQEMVARRKDIDNQDKHYIKKWLIAATDESYAYFEESQGINYYKFLDKVADMVIEEPQEIYNNLKNIQNMIGYKSGACVVYAGDEKSIKKNNKASKKFFEHLWEGEKKVADFSYLKKEYADTALVVSADMKINGLYAPFDVLGSEYSGKSNVIAKYVQDKLLIPNIRDKNNAYWAAVVCNEFGVELYSYRDPEVQKTFDVYAKIADNIADAKITQQEIDNYILTAYSEYIMPEGELEDAYYFALEYMNGTTYEDHIKYLREIKSTTVEDVKNSAPMFEKLWTDGIKFTSGNAQTIAENADLYDVVLNPFNYE